MFRKLSFAVLLLALGQVAYGQYIQFGSCPDVKVAEGFNITNFAGEWYQQFSIAIPFDQKSKCTHAKYTVINGNTIAIDKSQVLLDYANQRDGVGNSEGIATENVSGILETAFIREGKRTVEYQMKVLGFSDDYIVLYSDATEWGMCRYYLWIVTKEQNPSKELLKAALHHVKDNKLNLKSLQREDQSDC